MQRNELVNYLDELLELSAFSGDVSNNGLQIEGKSEVRKVLFAVDGCQQTFDAAVREKADLVFVHHGLSWGGGLKRWTGINARRFAALFQNGISLYAAHLPLDAHPELGNNAVLSNIIGLEQREKFFHYDGVDIGFAGIVPQEMSVESLAVKLASAVNGSYLLRGDAGRICRKVAVVSGGGGIDSVFEAAAKGCDLLVTGEMEHIMHHAALELGVAVIALGHYASETTGPKALMEHIRGKFDLEVCFADCPTGL